MWLILHQSYDIYIFTESGLAALICELCPNIIVWELKNKSFLFVSRSLAATSRSRSSQWTCEGLQWNGLLRTSPARSTSLRCQLRLNLSCLNVWSMVNVSLLSSGEDSSRDWAADPVWDWQCDQWLVPSPHRNHQLTCENIFLNS